MPDIQKVRIGYYAGETLDDSFVSQRVLIGMDPASNDWLYSPDEIGLGEFGVLVMMAAGAPGNSIQQQASALLCRTIRQLFDQTLELPVEDDAMLRLLSRYFYTAHEQLVQHGKTAKVDGPWLTSFAFGLIRQQKIYLLWTGDIRVFRYNPRGTTGSLFTHDPRWQMLTVDHSSQAEHWIFRGKPMPEDQLPELLQQLGQQQMPVISMRVISAYRGDRFVISRDPLHEIGDESDVLRLLVGEEDADGLAVQLTRMLQDEFPNSTAHPVVVLDILEGPESPGFAVKSTADLKADSASLFGLPNRLPDEEPPKPEKRKLLAFNNPSRTVESRDVYLEPMRLRTVLPDEEKEPEKTNDSEMGVTEGEALPVVEQTLVPVLQDNPENVVAQPEESVSERASRLRIRMTVYPDPEDSPPSVVSSVQEAEESQEETNMASVPDPASETVVLEGETENQESESLIYEADTTESGLDFETLTNTAFPEEESGETEEKNIHLYEEIPDPPADPTADEETEDSDYVAELESEQAEHDSFIEAEALAKAENETSEPEHEEWDSGIESIFTVPSQETIETEPENEPVKSTADNTHSSAKRDNAGRDDLEWGAKDQGSARTDSGGSLKDYINTLGSYMPSFLSGYRWLVVVAAMLLFFGWWFIGRNQGTEDLIPAQVSKEEIPVPKKEPVVEAKEDEGSGEKENARSDTKASAVKKEDEKGKKTEKKPETPQKTVETEPEYDAQIQQNKLQLLDEVNALWTQKRTLCRKIANYRNNAPTRKQERLDPLIYDCEQLEEKFSSVYDPKSGFFRTTRYDFLTGTLNNIKVSMNRTENKLDEIRQE
jgi:serine/threonine protein phosphatase PrpC